VLVQTDGSVTQGFAGAGEIAKKRFDLSVYFPYLGFMKLNHLTDETLLRDTSSLVEKERSLNSQILWHLKEIDRRKLFVELKCSSLFDYCVKILKYSESQASRRVSGARLLVDLPGLSQQIEDGSLNLTQLNQASFFFRDEKITTPHEKAAILKKLEGRTTRETETILHEHRKEAVSRNVFLVVKEETKKKIDSIRNLKAHSCPDHDSLLSKMCDEVSKMWDPTLIKKLSVGSTEARYVPKMIQVEVWRRDRGECTKCHSTYALELDHIKPFAVGGKTTVENLRLLCRACNQRQRVTYFQNSIPDRNAFQLKSPSD
jgi:hypothetical protein